LSGRLLYLDASALVKLVAAEPETPALLSLLREQPDRISSALSIVELHRALRRAGAPPAEHRRAAEVLSRIALLRIDDAILGQAARLAPADLRSLDAIHLATALSVADDLAGFVAYDQRLSMAATRQRLRVLTPGKTA
jgi:predicted nucleic acid-binding protein